MDCLVINNRDIKRKGWLGVVGGRMDALGLMDGRLWMGLMDGATSPLSKYRIYDRWVLGSWDGAL